MNPTDKFREKLRKMLDEIVLVGDVDTDTRFTDADIDELIIEASNINEAAAAGWKLKAARAMSERGGLEESSAGDEKHRFVKLTEYRDHCLAMAEIYAELIPGAGSMLFSIEVPDVLGVD